MLRAFLRYMRSQPKIVRDQYALGFSAAFTGVIALIWIFTNAYAVTDDTVAREDAKSSAPFSSLLKQFGEQFATVRGSVTDLKNFVATSTATSTSTSISADATVTDPRDLVLTSETKSEVEADQVVVPRETASSSSTTSTTTSTTTTVAPVIYREVLIATTSASRSSSSTRPY